MNTQPLLRLLSLAFFFAYGAAFLHAAPEEPFAKLRVPKGLSQEGARAAVVKAALGRHWNIEERTEDQVIIHLEHRGWDSTLTFRITASEISIFSDSWTTNKKGDRKKKKDPTGWIENLEKDIAVFMNRELYG